MAFQIKDFISIVAGMINQMRATGSGAITDYNIGSVTRTLIEGPAVEVEELYLQMVNGLRESIPVAIYQAFDFGRRPATVARGVVTVSTLAPAVTEITIPQGTVFSIPGTAKTYESVAAATIAIGELSVDITVQAQIAGAAGNALAGAITETAFTGVDTVTNQLGIISGRNAETDAERKLRFVEFVQSLSRGTLVAIEFAARLATVEDADGNIIEIVDRVGVREDVPGRVFVYVYNGQGGTSDALVARAQALVDGYVEPNGTRVPGYRAGGVKVIVAESVEIATPLTVAITPLPGWTVDAAMTQGISDAYTSHLAALQPGETLSLSRLSVSLLGVPGVLSVDISAPSGNVLVGLDSVLIAGAVTVS